MLLLCGKTLSKPKFVDEMIERESETRIQATMIAYYALIFHQNNKEKPTETCKLAEDDSNKPARERRSDKMNEENGRYCGCWVSGREGCDELIDEVSYKILSAKTAEWMRELLLFL